MDLIIRNGKIVTEYDLYSADIGIKDEKIQQIAVNISETGDYEIDAEDKYVLPGFIDPHVHYNLSMRGTQSVDDFASGTKAAAAGGVTTILDFATQMGDQTLTQAINDRKREAIDKTFVDYGLHGGITNWNLVKPELEDIINDGISSFKMYMAYRERGLFSNDAEIMDALTTTKQLGGMILVHAESGDIIDAYIKEYHTPENMKKYGIKGHSMSRPNITEYEAIQRAILLNKHTDGHLYIVHMSTGEGAEMVKHGRVEGINVVGETCPQYLLFNESVFDNENGHYYATAPQVKSKTDNDRLWEGLLQGDLQVLGTDSCTFTTAQKDAWDNDFTKVPLGLPGTELMGSLLFFEGVIKRSMPLTQFVRLTSTNAAKIFGMYPDKGSLQVGTDADIIIFDPHVERIVHHEDLETNCDWSPYQDWKLIGSPQTTILRGQIVAQDGKCIGEQGIGQYIRRGPSGNFV